MASSSGDAQRRLPPLIPTQGTSAASPRASPQYATHHGSGSDMSQASPSLPLQHSFQRRRSNRRLVDEGELSSSVSTAVDAFHDDGSSPFLRHSESTVVLQQDEEAHHHPSSPRQVVMDPSSPAQALMYRVAKEVTNLFSPTLQYNADRRRSSAVSSTGGGGGGGGRSAQPPVDVAHYTVNYATCNPNVPTKAAVVAPPAASARHKQSAMQRTLSPRNGGNALLKVTAGSFENSFLSGSMSSDDIDGAGDGDGASALLSPRNTSAGAFFDPYDPEDPFEKDAFTVETRRVYQGEKQRDERLDAQLAHLRQLLLRRQTELPRPQEKRIYSSNIRFVTAANMWETLFAFVRFVQRAREAYTEEMFAQRVVRQMAPLCAIRLRQRLKRTRVAAMVPTISRPSLEVFKADRTFSHFPEDQLEGIRVRMELAFFFRNEAILYHGVQDDQCFIVERGIAETRDGLTVLNAFRKNHIVGALGMMVGEPRIHSVVASTPLYAWVIRRKDFDATLNLNDAKTKNALAVVNELRQKNIRDVYHEQLQPDALRQFLLFSGIRDTVLESIVAESTPRVFKRGDVILRAGDLAAHALFVIRGRVRLSVVPQMPLSTAKSIQLHVAETVCLQQQHHRRPADGAGGGAKKPNASLLVVRDDPPPASLNASLRGKPAASPCAVDETQHLDTTMSAAVHSVGSYADGGHLPGYHANGMACEVACPVLISIPSAMEGGEVAHRLHVAVLSESVDCLVISAEKLRNALHIDRETRQAFAYNLTCLALPFIQPLPKAQLLKTLFPKCFAFAFLPKLALHKLEQIPVVFAANDVIVMDGTQGDEACAVVVYKGQLQPSGGIQGSSSCCLDTMPAGQPHHVPFLWPEISFVCVPGAKAKARAVSAIEGVLIKRSQIVDLVHNSLRGSERTVMLDALKAHYTARVGRQVAGGGGCDVAHMPAAPPQPQHVQQQQATAPQPSATAHSGNQRIQMALYGTLDSHRGATDPHLFHGASKGGRVNPLIRGEVNAVNLPKYPDRTKSLDALVLAKQQLQRRQNSSALLASAESPPASPTAQSPKRAAGGARAPSLLNEWVSQAGEAICSPPDGSGCVHDPAAQRNTQPTPPPTFASLRVSGIATIVKATQRARGRDSPQHVSSPTPPPTARSLLASDFVSDRVAMPSTALMKPDAAEEERYPDASPSWVTEAIRRPLQQSLFIVKDVVAEPQRGGGGGGIDSRTTGNNIPALSTSFVVPPVRRHRLPHATCRRRQAELMEKCEALREAAAMTARLPHSRAPTSDGFQPTSASTRLMMAEHQRRAAAATVQLSVASGRRRTR